jgi:MauM/NapG family ferredoxin protein
MSWRTARWLRRAAQVASLLFFLVLAFGTLQRYGPRLPADAFFRFDPLAAFGAMIAGRQWLWHLSLALITVAVTVALGRVWCGWVCPMGTVLEYTRFKKARRRQKRLPPRLRLVKYVLLVMVVVGAALGSLTLMVLDPITLITRSTATSVIPGIDYVVRGVERVMAHVGWLQGAVSWIDNTARGHVLPVVVPVFSQALFLGLLFLGVIALNALADRFWCRYLCPLGALLGLLSKAAVLRPLVGEACTSCSRCAGACRLGAIDAEGKEEQAGAGDAAPATSAASPARAYEVVTSECTMCLDCLATCPDDESMRFGVQMHPGPWRDYDPGRRQFLAATAAGAGSVILLGTGWWSKVKPARLIRPPGVHDEAAFLSSCIRCGACLDVCPTSGLQPTLDEAGLAGLWTPALQSRLGYCAWQCTSCGQVCPTGAIPRLHLSTKRRDVIGTAVIDRDRCLPWSQGKSCVVCQEVCPVPKNAINLTGGKLVTTPDGVAEYLVYPKVRADRCVGCGICEFSCPVSGEAAIVVRPASTAPPPSKNGGSPVGERDAAQRA